MELVYVSRDVITHAHFISKVLQHEYSQVKTNFSASKAFIDAMKHGYIILQISKSYPAEFIVSAMSNPKFMGRTVIEETSENYYLNIPLDVIIESIYMTESRTVFIDDLIRVCKSKVPNPYTISKKPWKLTNILHKDYILNLYTILTDMVDINNDYMYLYEKYDDLTRDQLNRLFKIVVHCIIPKSEVPAIMSIGNDIIISANDYCKYQNVYHNEEFLEPCEDDTRIFPIYLNTLVKDGNYPHTIQTDIVKVIKYLYMLADTREHRELIPVSTLVDIFVTVSLNTIKQNSARSIFGYIESELLLRNQIMNFALNSMPINYDLIPDTL